MDTLSFDFETAEQPQAVTTRSNIVPRATVRDMVQRRQAALEAFGDAYTSLVATAAAFKAATAAHHAIDNRGRGDSYLHATEQEERHFLKSLKVPDPEKFREVARKVVDRRMWSVLIELTELEKIMDKQAKDQLRQSLIDNPPEANEANIFATIEQFALDADTIFKRGIANCFSKLDRRFRTHDGWKIGNRIILYRMFSDTGHLSYSSHQGDTLYDVDRTLHVLDGKGNPTAATGIIDCVRRERSDVWGKRQSEHETEYLKVRCYENGNAHLWFKRKDLVEKVNELLGEYYGAPIPEEREAKADPFADPKRALARNYAFFPTPDATADTVVEYARLYRHDQDAPPLMVLEPSAGAGQLARRCIKQGARVHCIEVHPERAAALQAAGYSVTTADFLAVAPLPLYDRVVMNPPFDRERDIDHVVHALKFLKPDGMLIAIMSAGTEFRETAKAVAFRELMASMGAVWEDLPPGSFSSVGTNVNTLVVRVWKDGRKQWGMR